MGQQMRMVSVACGWPGVVAMVAGHAALIALSRMVSDYDCNGILRRRLAGRVPGG